MNTFKQINIELPKEEKFRILIPQVKSLIEDEDNFIANLSNITSAIKYTFSDISWVGFYFIDKTNPGQLVLGPFQGKVACTRIALNKGVCSAAVMKKESIVVNDVEKFPGHIYCDPDARSEIVIPVIKNNNVIAVLDIDSNKLNTFDGTDKKNYEVLIKNILSIF
jgi:GAF domain-containing protein